MAQSNKKSAKNLFRQPTPPPSRQLIRYSLIFIAGLLLGWFVLGWWLFPIEYTQVYPNELRDEARDEYFQMVAEGYALTGDRIRAARRLQYWNVDDELQRVINARILALESTDPAAAEPLRRLAEDLHLTQTTALPRTSGQSPTGGSSNLGRSILYLLGGMLVLALLYFLYKQVLQPRMSAPSGETTPLGAALPSGENAKEVAIDGDFEPIETLSAEPIPETSPPPKIGRVEESGGEHAYRPEAREMAPTAEIEPPGDDVEEV
ncbi:MAG TPA: hypothetical protein G4N94_06975, partial [Caldilineae bacterium]|nr:hypothetical protein [Caldilineae bacterium]